MSDNPFVRPAWQAVTPERTLEDALLRPQVSEKPVQEPRGTSTYYHNELAIDGRELQNYVKRTPIEEGKYVLITTHKERLEKVKQPEEIAAEKAEREAAEKARRRSDAIAGGVIGTIVLGFFGALGYLAYKDEQANKPESKAQTSR